MKINIAAIPIMGRMKFIQVRTSMTAFGAKEEKRKGYIENASETSAVSVTAMPIIRVIIFVLSPDFTPKTPFLKNN